MKDDKIEPIKDTVKRVIKNLSQKSSSGPSNIDLIKAWEQAAGKRIKQHTKPVNIKDGVLTVNVDSSSWLFELKTKYKQKIIDKLDKKLKENKIEQIRFKIGDIL
jgi:predicted nucleic acid-binding Zn ribbon protein